MRKRVNTENITLNGSIEMLGDWFEPQGQGDMTDPAWQNSIVLSGDPVQQVRTVKQAPGKDIILTGSTTLTHALIAAGLVVYTPDS